MMMTAALLEAVTSQPPDAAWATIIDHVWSAFSAPIASAGAETVTVNRDRGLTELDNVLSGSAWDLWTHFERVVPRTSQGIIDFWNGMHSGKAVLILDGLSLRECPWLLEQATARGYCLHAATARGAELPPETTPFANALGFAQRSSLENDGAGSSHKLKGAFTVSCDLPWKDCIDLVGSQPCVVFWHHWPDERMHKLADAGGGLHRLAKEVRAGLESDDFWAFVERLSTGRKLVITGDHGYAATGLFPDTIDKDQVGYLKSLFKGGRFSDDPADAPCWIPPIDLRLATAHGDHAYVLGRRKWKSAAGYPTLQHGGLSLLEVLVPFVTLSR